MNRHELEDLLRSHAEECDVAGAAVGVVKHGESTVACVGLADEEAGAAVTPQTRFYAMSLSKTMVSAVIARLIDQGRFGFDDPIGTLVPELSRASWGNQVMIRHLLSQTALVQAPPAEAVAAIDPNAETCFADACALIADQPLLCEPGTQWSYGPGWPQLARLIEVATSTPWAEAMHAELFAPLGMHSSGWFPASNPELGAAHYSVEGGTRSRVDPNPEFAVRLVGPSGGIKTTISDLLTFARVHVDDKSAYCDPKCLALLREPHTSIALPAWLDAWCLGLAYFDWEGGPVWGWEGIGTGHRAMLRLIPEHQGAIVQLTNTNSGRALYRSLFPVLLERDFGVKMPSVTPIRRDMSRSELARFEGTYGWPGSTTAVVEAKEGQLTVRLAQDIVDVVPVGDAWFLADPEDSDYAAAFTFLEFEERRPALMYYFLTAFPRCQDE